MKIYTLYVPADGAIHDIRRGSAILGGIQHGMVTTHYEGGGASNVQTFEEKVNQAAGRRSERYPTSALRGWHGDDVVEVGTVVFDEAMRHWVIGTLTDEASLREWVGPAEDIVPGGSDRLIESRGGSVFSQLSQVEQARIVAMRLPMTAMCAEAISTMRRKSSQVGHGDHPER